MITGTKDLMTKSLFQFAKYYGWVPVGGSRTKKGIKTGNATARACIEDAVRDILGERYDPERHATKIQSGTRFTRPITLSMR